MSYYSYTFDITIWGGWLKVIWDSVPFLQLPVSLWFQNIKFKKRAYEGWEGLLPPFWIQDTESSSWVSKYWRRDWQLECSGPANNGHDPGWSAHAWVRGRGRSPLLPWCDEIHQGSVSTNSGSGWSSQSLRAKSLLDKAANWQQSKGNLRKDPVLEMRPHWRKDWAARGLADWRNFGSRACGASGPCVGSVTRHHILRGGLQSQVKGRDCQKSSGSGTDPSSQRMLWVRAKSGIWTGVKARRGNGHSPCLRSPHFYLLSFTFAFLTCFQLGNGCGVLYLFF